MKPMKEEEYTSVGVRTPSGMHMTVEVTKDQLKKAEKLVKEGMELLEAIGQVKNEK